MTDQEQNAGKEQEKSDQQNAIDADSFDLEGVADEAIEEVIESVRISGPEGEMPLKAVMLDLAVAHKEIEDYKKGALSLYQALDERQHEAKAQGNEQVAAVIEEIKESAFGVYLRITRGDAELTGDRDGKYSGYFEEDADADD